VSKQRDKQRRPERPRAGLSSLRPRLDQLLRSERFSTLDQRQIVAELDALTKGINPATFLPTLIAALSDAPAEAQARLNELLPKWLQERGDLAPLRDLIARHALDDEKRQHAVAWLANAGDDTGEIVAEIEAWDPFYGAYYAGNPSQASLMFFWYTSRRQHRVHGLSLLLDFEPPWDGAVKDAMRYPQRAPEAALVGFVHFWRQRGEPAEQLPATEAKRRALDALAHNRTSNIRLHPDLVAARDLFVGNLLALPDGPDTPRFTAADFDFLASHGEHPEALRRQEQLFGYRARTSDGKEIRIIRGPEDW